MAIRAYVLVDVRAGTWENIAQVGRTLHGIKNCEAVTGSHDIIVTAEVENLDDLRETLKKLQAVEGIIRTTTCVVL